MVGVQRAETAVLSAGSWGGVCLERRWAGGQPQADSMSPGFVLNRATEQQSKDNSFGQPTEPVVR